ncbi:MAG TPA: DsbC family protein [Burkholderiales bacterium]|nr:DsbC family protein [Burkholderiales bacterium]
MLAKMRLCLCVGLLFSSAALASEATVKQAIQKKYPGIQVESVTRTPIARIYEVFANGEILYVDENVDHMIVQGRLIDVGRRVDLTEERLRVLTAVKFDQLPLDLAFRKVLGNGKRRLAYFSDPNCPYCKKLEPDLAKLENVTIYIFLYPVLGQNSYDKSKAVWCSKDRVKVWDEMMLNGKPPKTAGACDTPIEKILAFGRRQGITGTPTLYFADGRRVTGWIPGDQLRKLLDEAR